ncbi:hypothetical protein QBC43DRAFT_309155 [Cladorrhinum sp. PSN259]|nr:hypothetical protein QBC43DRAFT_309155 [Cladorrhinum sp. PSN259]
MTSRIIPHLLEPYLSLPEETALVVLTGILGASTNWLVWRYLHAFLKPSAPTSTEDDEVSVLLVSFLRDLAFFKEGMGRLGVDLEAAGRKGKFGFVDGLSGLYTEDSRPTSTVQREETWKRTLRSGNVKDIGRAIENLLVQLKPGAAGTETRRKVILVLDGLDFLVAAASGVDNTGAVAVRDMVMDLREKSHGTIITLAADDPLIKEQVTPLETNHACFVLSLAHDADTILSLRLLDTGTAKDVSGVIRITHGGQNFDTKDHEYLYNVGGDGGVRVFERGQ